VIIDKQISVCPTLGDDNVAASASSSASASATAYNDCVTRRRHRDVLVAVGSNKSNSIRFRFWFVSLPYYVFLFFIIVRQNILWAMKSVVMPLRDELRVLPNSFSLSAQ